MEQQGEVRRLTTILSADIVGYSRLMGADEAGTLAALMKHRKKLVEPKTSQYRGRGDDIYGDGVKLAARLEALAQPGGICISGLVHEGLVAQLSFGFEDLGDQQLKKIAKPVRTYRVLLDPDPAVSVPVYRQGRW